MQPNFNNESTRKSPILTGMFADRESIERAYNALNEPGYTKDEINLVLSGETRNKYYPDKNDDSDPGTKAAETAGAGLA
jgi:hypothetical protein